MEEQIRCGTLGLEYPCLWIFKVIGSDPELIRNAIAEVLEGAECVIAHSNSSAKGKYHCLNLEINVSSEDRRNQIYRALQCHPSIRMVL